MVALVPSDDRRCGCGTPLPAGRRCRHCPECSAAASRAHRAAHAAPIAERRRQRRAQGRFSDQRAADIARAKMYVYLRRGVLRREACRCGSWDVRPYLETPAVPEGVRWACAPCRRMISRGEAPSSAETAPSIAAPASAVLVDRRGTIAAEIAAMPAEARARVEAEIARRRPANLPSALWRPSSLLWRDAAIAAVDGGAIL